MSYILEALRKSEQERQVAAGQPVGMLYSVAHPQKNIPWGLISFISIALVTTGTYFEWTHTQISEPVPTPATVPTTPNTTLLLPTPDSVAQVQENSPSQPKFSTTKSPANKTPALQTPLPLKKSPLNLSTKTDNDKIQTASSVDLLKDLPPLSITGYIHNEDSGNLAMINNQLVHEGEEISPGLRLIKILEDRAVFSYKGFIFSR